MEELLYAQLAEIEDQHWWFTARRELVAGLLHDASFPVDARALDLGCGTGGNMDLLHRFCPAVTGIDKSPVALALARKKWPGFEFLEGDINKLDNIFIGQQFDLVTIFNVLYHQWVNDDKKIIRQVFQLLKPGGYLVLTEPAFDLLRRRHDIQDMGRKRYRIGYFQQVLRDCGFQVIRKTYFNSIAFIPALGLSLLDRLCPKNDQAGTLHAVAELAMPPKPVNTILTRAMHLENMYINKMGNIPFGVSLLCIAWKEV